MRTQTEGITERLEIASRILALNYLEWHRNHKRRDPRASQEEINTAVSKTALDIADALIEAHNQTEGT